MLPPPKAQGLNPHPDGHDVFVAQIVGRKRWQLYSDTAATRPTDEFELHVGDCLYLPKGLVHEASTDDEFSVHLTVGLTTVTIGELLLLELERLVLADPECQKSLPSRLSLDDRTKGTLATVLHERITELTRKANVTAMIEDAVKQILRVQRAESGGRLQELVESASVTAETLLRIRDGCRVETRENRVSVTRNGRDVSAPASVRPAIEYATERDGFCARDLPGLDQQSQVVLAQRLLDEGIVALSASDIGPQRSIADDDHDVRER